MELRRIYDLPTRVFHWLFAGLFLIAFIIAKTVDDEAPVFIYHMLAGGILVFVVFLRILWGFWGTKHARFSDFALHPRDLFSYFRGILSGDRRRWAGHNPASSWAALTMMALAVGLGITGYLMTSGSNKEDFEDLHELLANGFIIVVVLHVAGLVLHTLRHHEMIGLSMIHGRKANISLSEEISSPHTALGILFLGLVVAFGSHLYQNYDSQNGRLQFFGSVLQLGENEGNEGGGEGSEKSSPAGEGHDEDED